jgi:hypothetical protein
LGTIMSRARGVKEEKCERKEIKRNDVWNLKV